MFLVGQGFFSDMKKYFLIYLLLSVVSIYYISLPLTGFPEPLPGSVQSGEPADTESPFRRAYFTDMNREEIVEHYFEQVKYYKFKLNHPPEDAQSLIRDQTRSSYLEEISSPFRESVYVNGFIPSVAKDEIWYEDVHYEEKITVRYTSSSLLARVIFVVVSIICLHFVLHFVKDLFKNIFRK